MTQNQRNLFGCFSQYRIVLAIEFNDDCGKGRRPGRHFGKPDRSIGFERTAGFVDLGTNAVYHHEGGFVPLMFVCQIDDDLSLVFESFEGRAFDQAGIIQRCPLAQINLHIGHFFFVLEIVYDTGCDRFGLFDGCISRGVDIDGEGIGTFAWKHPGEYQFGWDHHHGTCHREEDDRCDDPLVAGTVDDGVDQFFHLQCPPFLNLISLRAR